MSIPESAHYRKAKPPNPRQVVPRCGNCEFVCMIKPAPDSIYIKGWECTMYDNTKVRPNYLCDNWEIRKGERKQRIEK